MSARQSHAGDSSPALAATSLERAIAEEIPAPALGVNVAQAEVRVWILSLDGTHASVRTARMILGASEVCRCERVIDPLRRRRLLLARAWVRVILAAELNDTPASLRITRSPSGRPTLTDSQAPSFSVSHSDGWVAVSVSSLARVGIDIELAERTVSEALVQRLLNTREVGSLPRRSPSQRQRAFLAYWTVKEACAKVLDGALASNLHRLQVEDGLSKAPRLTAPGLGDVDVKRLDLGPMLVGALAGMNTEAMGLPTPGVEACR
jgi:4'-phosphopantetheinyl transferase